MKNAFANGELDENMVVAKIATTTKHGTIEEKIQKITSDFDREVKKFLKAVQVMSKLQSLIEELCTYGVEDKGLGKIVTHHKDQYDKNNFLQRKKAAVHYRTTAILHYLCFRYFSAAPKYLSARLYQAFPTVAGLSTSHWIV